MKNTLLIITVILFTSKVLAQDFVIPKKTIEEIKKNGLLVNTGQVAPEVDEVFKKSINLYWRASSIKFVQYDERQINKEKEPLYFISNFKGIGVALNGKHEYTFTDFRLKNVGYGSYDCPYDNLVAKSIDYGVVKNNDHIKSFLPLYVKNFCYVFNLWENVLLNGAPRKLVSKYGKESDSLKNCTIIIPNEYLSNGFSKEIFDVIPNKKFMSIKEIGQMINDNNTKNTALFEAYRGIQSVSVRVLSVNSGNLFYGNDSGYPIFGDQVSTVDKISEKEMSKLIKEFVKFYN